MIESLSSAPSSTPPEAFSSPSTQGFRPSPPIDPFADLDRLGDQIAELSAHIQAATYRLLVLIREFDERGGWNTGFRSCAHWLNWRTGLDMGAAREKVRVAKALADLPKISGSMRNGELSYSKVRALTRVATLETEEELLEFALAGTAAHVERLVGSWRRVDRLEAMLDSDRQHLHRYLQTYPDEDGMLVVKARLTPEVGALFRKALGAATEVLHQKSREDEAGSWSETPIEQRRADALELMVESALHGDLDPGTPGDRYQVVVHVTEGRPDDVFAETCSCNRTQDRTARSAPPGRDVSAETSDRGGPGTLDGGELENGFRVSAETSRRIACDSGRVVMAHGRDGSVLDVGRKTRVIHPALRRALRHRDGGCRFPGCGHERCDAHHVEHWAEGGRTKLDNLVLLCRQHHRMLHEGGYRVGLNEDGSARFYTPRGKAIPEAPQASTLKADPAIELARRNWDLGIAIDPDTGLPSWNGRAIDINEAIQWFRGSQLPN